MPCATLNVYHFIGAVCLACFILYLIGSNLIQAIAVCCQPLFGRLTRTGRERRTNERKHQIHDTYCNRASCQLFIIENKKMPTLISLCGKIDVDRHEERAEIPDKIREYRNWYVCESMSQHRRRWQRQRQLNFFETITQHQQVIQFFRHYCVLCGRILSRNPTNVLMYLMKTDSFRCSAPLILSWFWRNPIEFTFVHNLNWNKQKQ